MKKILVLSVFILAIFTLFAAVPRVLTNEIRLTPPGNLQNIVTNTTGHSAHYIVRLHSLGLGEEFGTETVSPNTFYIRRAGSIVVVSTNQSPYSVPWPTGSTLVMKIWYKGTAPGYPATPSGIAPYPNYEYVQKEFIVAAGGGAMTYLGDAHALIVPPIPQLPTEYTISITSAPSGVNIRVDGLPLDPPQVTPYNLVKPAGWDGMITVTWPGYTWDPPSVNVIDLAANMPAHFVGTPTIVNPNPAILVGPGNGEVIQWAHNAPPTASIVLQWAPDPMGPLPEGYLVYWMDMVNHVADLPAVATAWNTPQLAENMYLWKIVPYITDPVPPGGKRMLEPVRASIRDKGPASVKGPAVGCPQWAFEINRDPAPPIHDYPNGVPIVVAIGITQTITGGDADLVDDPANPFPPFPNPAGVPTFQTVLYLHGAGPWTIVYVTDAEVGVWWSYTTNSWTIVHNVAGQIIFVIPVGGKDIPEVPIALGEETLPVVMSSFTAQLTAQNFVALTWVTQSESGMSGYRVYRGEADNFNKAIMITPNMIPAHNTSNQQVYRMEDHEVAVGTTYYYWLEAVEFNGASLFGPVSITVEGNVTPPLPEVTVLSNAYPNPFSMAGNTTIEVAIKAGETGTVTIYNILGQAVKTFNVIEGNHRINWNGRDSKGKVCGSGIYFYRLSTPSMNQTKKLVIVK